VKSRGFTLLELVVAMAVFSILSMMAYAGLNNVMNTQHRVNEKADRIVQLQSAFMFISRDIQQAVRRSVRDQYGDRQGAMLGAEIGTSLMLFTRSGYTNPAKTQRSNLLRVAYQFEDEKLYRLHWITLDQQSEDEPIKRLLIDKVEEVTIRYLDGKGEWQDQWPSAFGLEEDFETLPNGVEFNIKVAGMGEFQRLFRVVDGVVANQN